MNYKPQIGDLVRLQPDMGYEIDWISGRIISQDFESYYFDIFELCVLINKDSDYFYLLNSEGKVIRTPHKDYFILC